jgi:hypothetical protein
MDDFSAPRIEASAQNIDLQKRAFGQSPSRKRETTKKNSPSPSVELDDAADEPHKIDELA